MMAEDRCVLCGELIDPRGAQPFERMTGFGRTAVRGNGTHGGVNNLRLRVSLREYAHDWCVKDMALKVRRREVNAMDLLSARVLADASRAELLMEARVIGIELARRAGEGDASAREIVMVIQAAIEELTNDG